MIVVRSSKQQFIRFTGLFIRGKAGRVGHQRLLRSTCLGDHFVHIFVGNFRIYDLDNFGRCVINVRACFRCAVSNFGDAIVDF